MEQARNSELFPSLKMTSVDFDRLVKCLVFVWTTSLIISRETNAQLSNDGRDTPVDSQYFFYQRSGSPRDCQELLEVCPHSNASGVHYIKPDGYPEPFEVHCSIAHDSFGWTVINRRNRGGFVGFDRDWNSYKNGFGFLSDEYFIGNERLSHLTNQKNYQLVIEMSLSDGSAVSVSYSNFRVGDEFSGYKLLGGTQYTGATGDLSWCPANMVYGNCTCGQRRCRDPRSCQNTCTEGRTETCICSGGFYMASGECVPEDECGCYFPEELTVIPEGESYVNQDCTMVATCSNGQLTRDGSYGCSAHAVCEDRAGKRACYCNDGFIGDGQTCDSSIHTDCMDIYNAGNRTSGVYSITPTNWPRSPFDVYCDMADGGGWTVFQRRKDGDVDFYLDWDRYRLGFGDVADEHWLGNEQLYYLTNQRSYRLRIDLTDKHGASSYAKFSSFGINNETDNYRLSDLGTYSGTSADALSYHRGYKFSTKDRDHDVNSGSCAQSYHGAWWYKSCHYSNLNGGYHESGYSSVYWYNLPGSNNDANLKYTEMKIRPV